MIYNRNSHVFTWQCIWLLVGLVRSLTSSHKRRIRCFFVWAFQWPNKPNYIISLWDEIECTSPLSCHNNQHPLKMALCYIERQPLWKASTGPRLMTDTQHSTLKTQCIWMGESWVWSVNPECRVLSIHHKFWVQALNLWRFISTLHFKLQH